MSEIDKPNEWRDVLIDALIVSHIYTKEHDTDPRKALGDLIGWEHKIALDPAVSSEAKALRDGKPQTPDEEGIAGQMFMVLTGEFSVTGGAHRYRWKSIAINHGSLVLEDQDDASYDILIRRRG